MRKFQDYFWIVGFSLMFFLFVLPYFIKQAYAATLTVCPQGCTYNGGDGIQQAVDGAKDGDTIFIKQGGYVRAGSTPFNGKMGVTSCFVDLKGKNLTLKGEGNLKSASSTVLFGEGHDKGTHQSGDPFYHRAGICSKGGQVTIDNLHIKEFEGGGLQFFDTQLILKNNLIDGHDHGGVFLFNSALLAVNNYFVATIGFIPFGASSIKAINNTFYGKAIVAAVSCNDDVPVLDFVNNIVVDEELTLGIGGLSTPCPEKVSQFKDKNIVYNLLWKKGRNCYPHEYCDDFTGKINADPMFNDPAVDQRGWRWGGFDLKAGSPAINAGDPNIPGTKDLGATGGPCADPNSSLCLSFIQNNQPPLPAPTEAPQPTFIPGRPGTVGQKTFGTSEISSITNLQSSLEYILKNLPLPGAKKLQEKIGFDLFLYLIFSAVYIMVIHFAVGIKDFNIFLMIVYFILGGFVGYWFHSYEVGLALSIILSLIFF